jgi:hypothetical protein
VRARIYAGATDASCAFLVPCQRCSPLRGGELHPQPFEFAEHPLPRALDVCPLRVIRMGIRYVEVAAIPAHLRRRPKPAAHLSVECL